MQSMWHSNIMLEAILLTKWQFLTKARKYTVGKPIFSKPKKRKNGEKKPDWKLKWRWQTHWVEMILAISLGFATNWRKLHYLPCYVITPFKALLRPSFSALLHHSISRRGLYIFVTHYRVVKRVPSKIKCHIDEKQQKTDFEKNFFKASFVKVAFFLTFDLYTYVCV